VCLLLQDLLQSCSSGVPKVFLRIARKSILFEQKTWTKTFEIFRKKSISPDSCRIRAFKKKATEDKENIVLLPVVTSRHGRVFF